MNSSYQKNAGRLTYLYVLISCCLLVGASLGLCFYSAGVFYEPVADGLHITIAQSGLTTTYMLVCMAIATLLVPRLMHMIRYRYLLVLGVILAAGGTLGMAFCFHPTFLYIFSGIQGIGAALIGMVPATEILNRWFYSHSAAVMALCTATPAAIAALFAPLFGYALTGLGWRMALVVLAVLIVVLSLPALLLPFAARPEQLNMEPWGIRDLEPVEKRKRLKNPLRMFFAIAGLSIMAAALLGISQHFSGFGTFLGRDLVYGAGLFSMCMIGSIVMKLLGGFLAEKIGAGLTVGLLDVILLVVSVGMWISISFPNDTVLKVLAFFYGAAYALNDFSVPLLVRSQYGTVRYTRIYALMNFISTIMIAISIAVVGYLYDATMTYMWIWILSLLLEVGILAVTYVLIREEKRTIALTNTIVKHMPEGLRESTRRFLPEPAAANPDEEEEDADDAENADNQTDNHTADGTPSRLLRHHKNGVQKTDGAKTDSSAADPAQTSRDDNETGAKHTPRHGIKEEQKPADSASANEAAEAVQNPDFASSLIQASANRDSIEAAAAKSSAKLDAIDQDILSRTSRQEMRNQDENKTMLSRAEKNPEAQSDREPSEAQSSLGRFSPVKLWKKAKDLAGSLQETSEETQSASADPAEQTAQTAKTEPTEPAEMQQADTAAARTAEDDIQAQDAARSEAKTAAASMDSHPAQTESDTQQAARSAASVMPEENSVHTASNENSKTAEITITDASEKQTPSFASLDADDLPQAQLISPMNGQVSQAQGVEVQQPEDGIELGSDDYQHARQAEIHPDSIPTAASSAPSSQSDRLSRQERSRKAMEAFRADANMQSGPDASTQVGDSENLESQSSQSSMQSHSTMQDTDDDAEAIREEDGREARALHKSWKDKVKGFFDSFRNTVEDDEEYEDGYNALDSLEPEEPALSEPETTPVKTAGQVDAISKQSQPEDSASTQNSRVFAVNHIDVPKPEEDPNPPLEVPDPYESISPMGPMGPDGNAQGSYARKVIEENQKKEEKKS